MVETILSSPFFAELILPAILIFTIVFAILQKSGILGKGKVQIDAIVSIVVALLAVTFGKAVGLIVNLIPILAVSLVVILVFMILFGSVYSEEFKLPKGVQYTIGILAAITVIVAVVYFTGVWDYLREIFSGSGNAVASNVIFFIVIAAAIAVAIGFGKKP